MDWYYLIGLACITHLIVNSTPGIALKRAIGLREEEMGNDKLKDALIELTYCNLCLGFWIALIFTLNPMEAAISAVISESIKRYV